MTRFIETWKWLVVATALPVFFGCGGTTDDTIETRVVTEEELQDLPPLPPMKNSRFIPQEKPEPQKGKAP